ncbi:hypothetical protein SAMN05661093_05539 [Kibdelosporangium aridum]|uniref:Uncharacterized protein n=1 Tax=Kibdelosporangium aridum TaxID=2030 RepID=A0A1Y5XTT5_KIBAR|nr:hypothetical protein SAMN05661093_05539 [Kibdelosporangium aridum]
MSLLWGYQGERELTFQLGLVRDGAGGRGHRGALCGWVGVLGLLSARSWLAAARAVPTSARSVVGSARPCERSARFGVEPLRRKGQGKRAGPAALPRRQAYLRRHSTQNRADYHFWRAFLCSGRAFAVSWGAPTFSLGARLHCSSGAPSLWLGARLHFGSGRGFALCSGVPSLLARVRLRCSRPDLSVRPSRYFGSSGGAHVGHGFLSVGCRRLVGQSLCLCPKQWPPATCARGHQLLCQRSALTFFTCARTFFNACSASESHGLS